MNVYRISRTKWVILAIAVGALLAWLQSGSARTSHTQTHSAAKLEVLLTRQPVTSSDGQVFSWTRNVRIYPPVKANTLTQEGEVEVTKAAVTFDALSAAPDRKGWLYRPGTTLLSVPVQSTGGRQFDTVSAYFADLASNRDWVRYHYAWWADPVYAYPVWIIGSILVIGVAWPMLLGILMRAGYGPSPEELAAPSEKSGWLKSLFTRPEPASAAASKPTTLLSEDDLARIAAMEDDLRDFAMTRKEQDEDEPSEQPVRELNATPLAPAPVAQQPGEKQEYDGEFYPTVAHAKKKPDSKS